MGEQREQRVVRYHTALGVRHAIIEASGRKLRCVVMDAPLQVRRVDQSEARYMVGLAYPIRQAKKRFRHAGRHLGIDRNARRFLRGS